MVVVSNDAWNEHGGNELLAVPIAPYLPERVYSKFDFGIHDANDLPWIVQASLWIPVYRAEFTNLDEDLWLSDVPHAVLDETLDRILVEQRAPRDPQPPLTLPAPHQTRFADLHIRGEQAKPVLIVSGSGYSADTGFTSVLATRMTSKLYPEYRYDVIVGTRRGQSKVVCSDVQTIPTDWLKSRSPEPSAVNQSEWTRISRALRDFLGLPAASARQA